MLVRREEQKRQQLQQQQEQQLQQQQEQQLQRDQEQQLHRHQEQLDSSTAVGVGDEYNPVRPPSSLGSCGVAETEAIEFEPKSGISANLLGFVVETIGESSETKTNFN